MRIQLSFQFETSLVRQRDKFARKRRRGGGLVWGDVYITPERRHRSSFAAIAISSSAYGGAKLTVLIFFVTLVPLEKGSGVFHSYQRHTAAKHLYRLPSWDSLSIHAPYLLLWH